MANTSKGIHYPDKYSVMADVPEDMKKMAESIDKLFKDNDTKNEQQNAKIQNNAKNIQTLQNRNTDLQQQNVNLQQENALLKSQIPNGQAEGENITITDSSNLPYEKFNIGGKSVQETRSGKNELILPEKENSNFRGGTISINDGVITLDGTTTEQGVFIVNTFQVKETGNYCFSRELSQTATSIWVLLDESTDNSIWTSIVDWNFSELVKSSVLSLSKDKYYRIRLSTNANLTFSSLTIKLQLELGNAKTDWEPYGASPSPEYPSEIKSVGDDGTVGIKQSGKNRIDLSKAKIQNHCKVEIDNNKISVKSTSTGNLQVRIDCALVAGKYYLHLNPPVEGMNIAFCNSLGGKTFGSNPTSSKVIELADDTSYIIINTPLDGGDYVLDFKDLYINEGTEDLGYEPYIGNDYILQTSEPLRSLPNGVRDTIEEDGIHRRVGSVVLDGSEDENWAISGKTLYSDYIKDYKRGDIVPISNYFAGVSSKSGAGNMLVDKTIVFGSASVPADRLYIKYDSIENETEFKAWLQSNPIQVNYELAEEVIEPYTDNPLQKATSYKNITHIFSTDEVSPVFDITYKKDLETLFNNLNSALVQGGM